MSVLKKKKKSAQKRQPKYYIDCYGINPKATGKITHSILYPDERESIMMGLGDLGKL